MQTNPEISSPQTSAHNAVTTKVVRVGDLEIGGSDFVVMAGPCSIENRNQFLETAQTVKNSGAHMLRGGLFKMRTSPESFQGLGPEAFNIVQSVKQEVGLPFVSEITDPRQMSDMYDIVDMFQVGSRNMHNYSLLKELGQQDKPILLKRSFSGRIDEWLMSAEYILKEGNPNVILCERGIRTFETATRNTFDLNAVAYLKQNTHLPVIADPSHGTGQRQLVQPMALAAAAAGADGVIIEVHPTPDQAKSDGFQTLNPTEFDKLMSRLSLVLSALDRKLRIS